MRLRLAPNVRAIWSQSWTTPWVWPALVAYDLALGLVLLLGGPERISGPSFTAIRDAGGHLVVGPVLVVMALLLGAGAFIGRRYMFYVASAVAVVHFLLAAGFLSAVLTEPPDPPPMLPTCLVPGQFGCQPPKAALTGIATYLFVAFVHLANAALYGARGPLGPVRRPRALSATEGPRTPAAPTGTPNAGTDDAEPDQRGTAP